MRERLSQLSAAGLRINESLDFNSVLEGVLDSARKMAGARYGAIATFGEAGHTEDIVTSGLTPEEQERLWAFPGGAELFGSLCQVSEVVRIRDVWQHLRLLEFRPPVPLTTLIATPLLHRGKRIGAFFLAGKDDNPEFTADDAESLVTLAAQAALVVGNARQLGGGVSPPDPSGDDLMME